jgi:hypothetical protein
LDEETRTAYGNLVWKPLGRLRRRWEDNMKMGLKGIGCDDGMELGEDYVQWQALYNLC